MYPLNHLLLIFPHTVPAVRLLTFDLAILSKRDTGLCDSTDRDLVWSRQQCLWAQKAPSRSVYLFLFGMHYSVSF